ncbi:phosphatidylglycerophosphate synthase [Microterricola gilva]|uniref:Phosphatidylglycerophosphate synthase n=1 Tax=Microterricola gilva TaxID=393267 RepID=A0A4Q8AHU5_9MICO|nr:CDP-alcohol phosphatidyltransferase family protein [Microterricola gilva]RZU63987.1 phosphatidylglycerophosphate synthase [Microterricola gilva]
MVQSSYRAAVARLASAQKSGAGQPAYLRWVNRPLGRRAAAAASVLGLSPNAVTLLSALCSLAALLLIALLPPTIAVALGATALLLAGYALDSADGQLARLTGSGSLAGEWLDHVVDAARLPLFHLAIAVHFFRWSDSFWLVGAALGYMLLSSVWFFAQTLAEKLGQAGSAESDAPVWMSFVKTPYDVGTVYLTVLALPFPALFATLYLLLFAFTLAVAALSFRRKYRMLAAQSRPATASAGG